MLRSAPLLGGVVRCLSGPMRRVHRLVGPGSAPHRQEALRRVRDTRAHDGSPFKVREFIPHDSRLRFGRLNHVPNRCLQPAKPDNRHFRDCPLTGHAADMPKSTRMTLTKRTSSTRAEGSTATVGIVTRPPTQAASILRESIGYSGTPSTTKLRNFASLSRSGRRSLKAVELR
jgi:hypothetical protein